MVKHTAPVAVKNTPIFFRKGDIPYGYDNGKLPQVCGSPGI